MNETKPNYTRMMLTAAAYLVVIACAVAAIFLANINEYAKGILTFLLGRFAGYVDGVYNFEFGTTRSSKDKDETISSLAASVPAAIPGNAAATSTTEK